MSNALDTAFTNIADAIRSKNGSSDTYKPSEMPQAIRDISGGMDVESNAGAHNAIYRGKNLGTSVSSDQYKAIYDGTFDDLFIGDYWKMGNNLWRIAAFDYYYNMRNDAGNVLTDHHVIIVPDRIMGTARMEASSITTNGYNGSEMKTTNLASHITTIENLFGADHILTHKAYFTSASDNGYPSAAQYVSTKVDIMSERQVYGSIVIADEYNPRLQSSNSTFVFNGGLYTFDHSQFPLFKHDRGKIVAMNAAGTSRTTYWLRDVVSATYFARVNSYGAANHDIANNVYGVRPCFGIVGLAS